MQFGPGLAVSKWGRLPMRPPIWATLKGVFPNSQGETPRLTSSLGHLGWGGLGYAIPDKQDTQ